MLAVYFAAVLLIIGRIHYLENASSWREKQIFTGPEPGCDLNRIIILTTIIIVMLAWLLPTPAKALPAAAQWWREVSRPLKISQERLDKALAAQIVHAVTERTLTGQDNRLPTGEIGGLVHNIYLNAQRRGNRLEGVIDAAQVADAIVEDCNHRILTMEEWRVTDGETCFEWQEAA